jgi:3-deoxy-D-manno-octulosonic-acid transferase
VFERLLALRADEGKEDALRLGERRGASPDPRPQGFLVWIHAASVGEANSVLVLIDALLARGTLNALVTTTTLTSASLMAARLPKGLARHQFAPLDHPRWVQSFLDHWRPDLALIVESELWPNLLLTAEAKGVPLVLLNARLSERSFRRWLRARRTARRLLACFSLCLAQDQKTAARLLALGAPNVEACGNLKFVATPLPDLPAERTRFEAALGKRPCLVAASTHEGEEILIAKAARILKKRLPDFFLILVPRHPERGAALAQGLCAAGHKVALRSRGDVVTLETDIYVADSVGELGLFYRLAPLAFVGGSLIPHGGQNPLEPARLGRFVLHGPNVENFAETYAALEAAGAAQMISSAEALAEALFTLLSAPDSLRAHGARGASAVQAADQVLPRVLTKLMPFLPKTDLRRADGSA